MVAFKPICATPPAGDNERIERIVAWADRERRVSRADLVWGVRYLYEILIIKEGLIKGYEKKEQNQ